MKAVILGKAVSVRVKNKNYCSFYGDSSLMDIFIAKLIRILESSNIYFSCVDETFRSVVEKWGINFIHS